MKRNAHAARRPARLSLEPLEERSLLASNLVQGTLAASTGLTPNDPRFAEQWGHSKVSAPAAWSVGTGSSRVVVASLDSGVDYTHPDLYKNVWLNPGEIPSTFRDLLADVNGDGRIAFRDLNDAANGRFVHDGNGNGYVDAADLLRPLTFDALGQVTGGWEDGVDNVPNGYLDDLVGWNYVHDNNKPLDDFGHGTHTMGILGAEGNDGVGVAGVVWDVQIMVVKFITKDNTADVNDAVSGIYYAADNGAHVSNNSWGTTGLSNSHPLYTAIQYAGTKNHLVVAAAMNNGFNNDSSPWRSYPASYDLPNIIAVAATDSLDRMPKWSNYGVKTVDLAAPGVDILSTLPNGQYGLGSGTSMATPFVAGAAALLWSVNPGLSYSQVKSAILGGVDKVSGLSKKVLTGGRLNVSKSVAAVTGVTEPPAEEEPPTEPTKPGKGNKKTAVAAGFSSAGEVETLIVDWLYSQSAKQGTGVFGWNG